MSFEPLDWSVVVVGRWNKAILSPKGISKLIFEAPDGEPIRVHVPVDCVSAILVSNPDETLRIHVETERLQIDLLKYNLKVLMKAMVAGQKAVQALPITPISAVGYNLNFKSNEAPEVLLKIIECSIDTKIAENEFILLGKSLVRTLSFKEGLINLSIRSAREEYHINCNFHLATTEMEKAKEWLSISDSKIMEIMNKIKEILGVEFLMGEND